MKYFIYLFSVSVSLGVYLEGKIWEFIIFESELEFSICFFIKNIYIYHINILLNDQNFKILLYLQIYTMFVCRIFVNEFESDFQRWGPYIMAFDEDWLYRGNSKCVIYSVEPFNCLLGLLFQWQLGKLWCYCARIFFICTMASQLTTQRVHFNYTTGFSSRTPKG